MSAKRFHLAWFMNFTPEEWNAPLSSRGTALDGNFYVDMAKAMERACFDYIMIEDTLMISDAYGDTTEAYLKNAIKGPQHDPSPLAALIGANTSKLGVVATLSTLGYPPFLLARLCTTLDHICHGRFGWNIVTSGEDYAAMNFGLDELPPRQERYDIADEYMDLCNQLWGSWEPDAVVRDQHTGTFTDYTKVRPIHFEGKYFKCRGPLNTAPSPQGRPTFVQAGGSPRGRKFAAETADSIIAPASSVKAMISYRDDVRTLAAQAGRDPDDIKVLFLIAPVVAATQAAAHERVRAITEHPTYFEKCLAMISAITDIDFSRFDLDEQLPTLTTNGEQGSLDAFAQWGSGKTLRQLAIDQVSRGVPGLIGTPDQVAARMEEIMEEVGGDGFLITRPNTTLISREYITSICDGLVPALQRRGLTRTEYTKSLLRDTLREF